jgi:hypothetical protein
MRHRIAVRTLPWPRRPLPSRAQVTAGAPAEAVTREQMAVFLTATFGLRLYGP